MSFKELIQAMGISHPDDLGPEHIQYRVNEAESVTFDTLFDYLAPGALLADEIHPAYELDWEIASAESF